MTMNPIVASDPNFARNRLEQVVARGLATTPATSATTFRRRIQPSDFESDRPCPYPPGGGLGAVEEPRQ